MRVCGRAATVKVAVTSNVILPAQPTTGRSVYTPLGGDGITAPHGCYLVQSSIVGDASAGLATLTIQGDARWTNLVAWVNLKTAAAAGANDFAILIEDVAGSTVPAEFICGSMPQVAAALFGTNSAFLWFPAPIYNKGTGRITAQQTNVGVGETYFVAAQIYCFNIDVAQRTPLPILQWNVPGVSAPAAI